jgi:hypothetical protein
MDRLSGRCPLGDSGQNSPRFCGELFFYALGHPPLSLLKETFVIYTIPKLRCIYLTSKKIPQIGFACRVFFNLSLFLICCFTETLASSSLGIICFPETRDSKFIKKFFDILVLNWCKGHSPNTIDLKRIKYP